MARPALSEEAVRNNKVRIITSAIDMIREGGISSISARSLSSRTGMNSALMYRYFKDIDEVILFACVHVLQEYTTEMTNASSSSFIADMLADRSVPEQGTAGSDTRTDADIYLLSWELFCKHAFSNPEAYMTLFFSRHSANLEDIIKEYYNLFPDEIDGTDDPILKGMFRTSNLRNRNLIILIPVLADRVPESDIILRNDMTVSYFYTLLVQLASRDEGVTPESQTSRMLQACRYTLI